MVDNGNNGFETRSFNAPGPEPETPFDESRGPRRRPKRIFMSCFFIVLIVLLTSCATILARSNNSFFVGVKNGFFIRQLKHIFGGTRNELKGEKDDRINFLLMGIGGPGHEGPYLTDTIILASFKPSSNEASMLSIPRDLIVPTGNGQFLKVNHLYALNQKNGLDAAFKVTKETIGSTFGVPIHYMGVIDFQGFIELIDTIGGITVEVERDFTDAQFPAGPNRTQVVSFKKGKQKMDGSTALNFARSRHGNNGEGSDFARSKRQQKIILATKNKIASFNTLFNPVKITALFNLVNEYTKTDIEPWEVVKLIQLAKDVKPEDVYTVVLDDSAGNYLFSGISSVDGAYILQPIGGTYLQLQSLVGNIFADGQLRKEKPRIMVQNGTSIPNAAGAVAAQIERFGVKPRAVGNASRRDIQTTLLYDYTKGKKNQTRELLESLLDVKAQTTIPLELLGSALARQWDLRTEDGSYEQLDFLIILGEDVQRRERRELIRTLTADELRATSTPSLPTSTPDGLVAE